MAGRGGTGGSAVDVAADLPVDAAAPDRPADVARETAVDRSESMDVLVCGMSGQACCPGNACGGGGCCLANGRCVSLGDSCSPTASCVNGSCGGCGGLNDPCCENRRCTASLTTCLGVGDGACQACGGVDQPCCAQAFCGPGLRCDSAREPPAGRCVAAP